MPLTIRRVSPADVKIKAMIYGDPGVGKTTFAAQANDHPSLAPALFLSFEGGLLSVASRGDIDAIEINSMRDFEDAYLALLRKSPGFEHYKTVVIDSGSELYNLSLQESVDGRKRNPDPDNVEIGDYGRAGYQTIRLFRQFRDLPMHVITTAHPKKTYATGADVRTADPILVTPSFSGRVATTMMGINDFVWFMYNFDKEVSEGVTMPTRGMLTRKIGAYEAKTRGPNFQEQLGSYVESPYLPAIYDLLMSSENPNGLSDPYLTEEPQSVIMGTNEEAPEQTPNPITGEMVDVPVLFNESLAVLEFASTEEQIQIEADIAQAPIDSGMVATETPNEVHPDAEPATISTLPSWKEVIAKKRQAS